MDFNAFNIEPKPMSFDWGTMHCLVLGEQGRGRRQTIVPCAENCGNFVELAQTKTGRAKIVPSSAPKGTPVPMNWLARISTEGVYTRHSEGWVGVLDPKMVKLVAAGHGAAGEAGRLGKWADVLITVQDNALLRVKPEGGYKTPAYFLHFTRKGVGRFYNLEQLLVALDTNESMPTLSVEQIRMLEGDEPAKVFTPVVRCEDYTF